MKEAQRQRREAGRRCGSGGPPRAIVDCQIPVCAHIGLTPQGINALGGFKVQGKTADSAASFWRMPMPWRRPAPFAVVLEAIPAELAERVSAELTIPTIGTRRRGLRRPRYRPAGRSA